LSNEKFIVQDGLSINTVEVFNANGILTGPSGTTINVAFAHANAAFDKANTASSGTLSGNVIVDSLTSNTFIALPESSRITGLTYVNTSIDMIDTFNVDEYRSVKYQIQITSPTGYESFDYVVLYDGVSLYGNTFNELNSAGSIGTPSANIAGNIATVYLSVTSYPATVAFIRDTIVNTGSAFPTDLMLPLTGDVTIDLMDGSATLDLETMG